jgi:DNA primase
MLFGTETFTIEKEKEAEEWQVAVYVLSNMEDVLEEFDNPLYKKIVHFIYDNLAEEKFFSAQDFVNHEDKEIQKLAIDLSTSPYEYSDNWINRFEKPLSSQPMPDDNFKADAIKGVNVFKLIKIQRVYEKNQRRLKGIGNDDFEEMMRLLKIQKKLMDIRSELAELTGTVVLR